MGYRLGKPGCLEPDPETAPVVRRIFELRESGLSYERIADRLYLENIPAPGKRWYATTVMYILRRREFYRGRATLHTTERRTQPVHQAII
jgi:hypothetical protein